MLRRETICKILKDKKEKGEIDDWGTDYHGDIKAYYIEKEGVIVYLYDENVLYGSWNCVSIWNVSYWCATTWINRAIKNVKLMKEYGIKYCNLKDIRDYEFHEKLENRMKWMDKNK